jgi:hypothetical protein
MIFDSRCGAIVPLKCRRGSFNRGKAELEAGMNFPGGEISSLLRQSTMEVSKCVEDFSKFNIIY